LHKHAEKLDQMVLQPPLFDNPQNIWEGVTTTACISKL